MKSNENDGLFHIPEEVLVMSEWIDILKEYVLTGKISNNTTYELWKAGLYPDNCVVDKMTSRLISKAHDNLRKIAADQAVEKVMRGLTHPFMATFASDEEIKDIAERHKQRQESAFKIIESGINRNLAVYEKEILKMCFNHKHEALIYPIYSYSRGSSWRWIISMFRQAYNNIKLAIDMGNRSRPDLESVIHWHASLIGACLKIMFEHDFDIVRLDPIFGIYLLDLDNINFDTYLSIKRKAQRNLGVDYLYNIKISHRLNPWIGSFDYHHLNDDEAHLKRMLETLWIPDDMIHNFNQTPVKNMWLERKTKRGK